MKVIIRVAGKDKPLIYVGRDFEIEWTGDQIVLSNGDEDGILSEAGDALRIVRIERSGVLSFEEAL